MSQPDEDHDMADAGSPDDPSGVDGGSSANINSELDGVKTHESDSEAGSDDGNAQAPGQARTATCQRPRCKWLRREFNKQRKEWKELVHALKEQLNLIQRELKEKIKDIKGRDRVIKAKVADIKAKEKVIARLEKKIEQLEEARKHGKKTNRVSQIIPTSHLSAH